MSDDLARGRILSRTPIPPEEKHRGWFKYLTASARDRRSEWEVANHCAFGRDVDDGCPLYVSFAHHKIVRFPTMGAQS